MTTTSPKESTIVVSLSKKMRGRGWLVTKIHGGPHQRAGLPDLMVIVPPHGLTFWVEVKRPGGVLTKLQEATAGKLREAGSPVYVATSSEDHIVEWLEREMVMRISMLRFGFPWWQSKLVLG